MTHEIRLAATDVELEALYAFRYRIYVEEMGRPQKYADHDMRRIRDPLDETGRNLVAWDNSEIVGCVRVNFARDGGWTITAICCVWMPPGALGPVPFRSARG